MIHRGPSEVRPHVVETEMPVPDVWNIFSIGRRRGDEDQLTEMLVWLATAVPEVAKALVRLALDDIEFDPAALDATTQHNIVSGRLDAFFSSPAFALVVESKLGSSYGQDQLRRYLDWLGTEHKDLPHRALLTLTAARAPWPTVDDAHAGTLGIAGRARRWEDLSTELANASQPAAGDLAARLVQEFLDMLEDEGLVPIKPLAGEELRDAWSRSQALLSRFHDYFRACEHAIGQALEATPRSRLTATQRYVYRDFETNNGELIGVGFEYSDEELPIPPRTRRNVPIVWLTVEAKDWRDWPGAIVRLEATPPEGWRLSAKQWWYRPRVWRYLDEIVDADTFEQQCAQVADACGQGRDWLLSVRTTEDANRPSRRWRR